MGNRSTKPADKQSSSDIKAIRDARVKYQDYLTTMQTNTQTDVSNNALTPETGSVIYKVIQASYKWLKTNPNANLIEILANQDATTIEIKRLMGVDVPKRKFNNTILALPAILDKLVENKTITADKKYAFLPTIITEKAWYSANQEAASNIDFIMEFQKINDTITTTFVDQAVISAIQSQIAAAQAVSTSQLRSQLSQEKVKQKELEKQTVSVTSTGQTIINTATSVFISLFITCFCIMCGSFAANMAIGRVPMYRVLYFIYGCLPICAPFILLYVIYKRMTEGKFYIYALLPCSIEPATTRLGKILWSPFYWIPDQNAIDEYNKYMAAIPLQVA